MNQERNRVTGSQKIESHEREKHRREAFEDAARLAGRYGDVPGHIIAKRIRELS